MTVDPTRATSRGERRSGSPWALAPWIFLVVLGEALYRTHGHFDVSRILLVMAAFGCAAWAVVRAPGPLSPSVDHVAALVVLAFQLIVLPGANINDAVRGSVATTGLSVVLQVTALLSAVLFVLASVASPSSLQGKSRQLFFAVIGALLLLLVVSRVLVLRASPQPHIDVFTIDTAAADFLIAGKNPYTQSYEEMYGGKYGYPPSFNYLPGLALWIAPFRLVFGDIRYAFLAAELLFVTALYRIVRARRASPATALLIVSVWLSFPVAWFVLEQSWIDGLLLALLGWIGWSLLQRRVVLAGVLLGLLVAVKQYAVIAAIVTVASAVLREGWRRALQLAVATAGVAGGVVLPFVLMDPAAFWQHNVTKMLGAGYRRDAFCLPTLWVRASGVPWPELLSAAIGLGTLVGLVVWMRGERGEGARGWGGALFVAYGVLFLFARFAFCNYYYLLAATALLFLAIRDGGAPSAVG